MVVTWSIVTFCAMLCHIVSRVEMGLCTVIKCLGLS